MRLASCIPRGDAHETRTDLGGSLALLGCVGSPEERVQPWLGPSLIIDDATMAAAGSSGPHLTTPSPRSLLPWTQRTDDRAVNRMYREIATGFRLRSDGRQKYSYSAESPQWETDTLTAGCHHISVHLIPGCTQCAAQAVYQVMVYPWTGGVQRWYPGNAFVHQPTEGDWILVNQQAPPPDGWEYLGWWQLGGDSRTRFTTQLKLLNNVSDGGDVVIADAVSFTPFDCPADRTAASFDDGTLPIAPTPDLASHCAVCDPFQEAGADSCCPAGNGDEWVPAG